MSITAPARKRSHRARKAFTLVELLFVIGIMAVLIALLLPGINQARRQAKMTTCANQLHQIHIASQTWKVKFDPQPLSAVGWRSAYAPLVENLTVYNCPESDAVQAGTDAEKTGDRAGTGTYAGESGGSSAAGGGGGGGGTPGSAPGANELAVPVSETYVHVVRGDGSTWDVPIEDGPWWKKSNVTSGSYEMWLEDQGGNGGGDRDFKDIGVKVTDLGDGKVMMELLPLPKGLPGYVSSVKAKDPNGGPDQDVFKNAYRSGGTPGGTKKVLDGPYDPGSSDPGSTGGGTSTGSGGTGTAGTGLDNVPGYATMSDYGMNDNVRFIDGDGRKVYLMDYTYSVIRPLVENWSTKKTRDGKLLFARHLGMANVVYGDGSVRPERVSAKHMNPADTINFKELWNQ